MPETKKKIAAKKQKRRNIIDSITRIEAFLNNYQEERDSQQLKLRLNRLDSLMENFEETQSEYEGLVEDSDDEADADSLQTRAKVEEQYFRVKGGLLSKVPPPQVQPIVNQPQQEAPAIAHITSVKLPTISLPHFDGDLEEWLTFHDSFSSLIHSSQEIPCIQKFQYLRSALKGDALKLIESLTITANNYAVAWEALLKRYSNKYLLKKKHLQALTMSSKVSGKSPSALRSVVEDFERHIKILSQLNEPTQHWSSLLVHLLCSRVDDQTLKEWEEFVSNDGDPTYENLTNFLTKKIRTLESLSISAPSTPVAHTSKHSPPTRQMHKTPSQPTSRINSYAATEGYQPECIACNQRHLLVKCPTFEKMHLKDRLNLVNTKRVCSNCFRSDHFVRKCQSNYSCRLCQKRHHTLLHPGFETAETVSDNSSNPSLQAPKVISNPVANLVQCHDQTIVSSNSKSTGVSSNNVCDPRSVSVFLSTVVLVVLDGYGKGHLARALLDSGSQCNLMSERLCQQLRLVRRRVDQSIFGVGETQLRVAGSITTEIRSRCEEFSVSLDCLVLRNLTTILPTVSIPSTKWKIPDGITLADPEFNVPRRVDLIIGAEHFYTMLKGGRIQLGQHSPTLVESVFGWFASGKATFDSVSPTQVCCVSTTEPIDQLMERFWQIEEIDTKVAPPSDKVCEEFYQQTVSRDSTGRYQVKYPKTENFAAMVGGSYPNALKRLVALERKLERNADLKERYHSFMADFIDLGHMQKLPDDDEDPPMVHYLPHHPVIKESSTTTKVRGVFDASAKTTTGYSLNDALLTGPVIQDQLLDIILRFRKYKIALLADIEKMYRQVSIHPDDRSIQRVLWRFNTDEPVAKYALTTVTYGLAPSSFLATRTLHQLAEDEGASFPMAASALKHDFYMDDFIRGESTIERAIQLRKEMEEVMRRGGFHLRKWCSNAAKVLEGVPPEDLATQPSLSFDPEETIKTLGISWEPSSDQFRFDVVPMETEGKITKRNILSGIARLYDPLGLIAPIVVRAKILMQQLWLLSLDWDDQVPKEVEKTWINFVGDLPKLSQFRIDRFAFGTGDVQLHCFADASNDAYGACIYVRSIGSNGEARVELLSSKSRVVPLKKPTIPRLELCAAQLAARLYTKVRDALKMDFELVWFWSDSKVVLDWLRSPPHIWKTYVANRVADIQGLTHGARWRHVPGKDNPADCVSRGMPVEQFLSSELWRHGPAWLRGGEEDWPNGESSLDPPPDVNQERKQTSLVVQIPSPPNRIFTLFSTYDPLLRATAHCLRVTRVARKEQNTLTPFLSVDELNVAMERLVMIVQAESFGHELNQLRKGHPVSQRSQIKLLNPFLDQTGIIRVGGRLRLSNEPYTTKHPILLPGFHPFTRLLIESIHLKLVHGGISLTLAVLRDEFWPINGRRAVRSVLRSCYRCIRAAPRPIQQPVGQLPLARTIPSRPFSSTGVDYCGPVFVKFPIRKSTTIKAYIALFVCFTTKAVHIELVGDLSTASFLSALRRFIARRGKPEHIYSDNATNFAGAKNELNALYRMFSQRSEVFSIVTSLATDRIQWHMIPPRAPNFGGLWEAAVKVAKKHLVRQLGNVSLFHEDLVTILTQIEGCMNSRPLVPLSEDPNDLQAITPGHFLVGTSLQALPESDLSEVPVNRLNRFEFIQQKVQHFWNRWRTEYLRELQQQAKVNPQKVELKVDQVVILQDQQLPPTRWPLARIVSLHPGEDGVSRVVTLRTQNGIFKRPSSKLCLLPCVDEDVTNTHEDVAEESTMPKVM